MPDRSFSNNAFILPAAVLTSEYLGSSDLCYLNEPQMMIGIGKTANSATCQEMAINTAPTTNTVVDTCRRSGSLLSF